MYGSPLRLKSPLWQGGHLSLRLTGTATDPHPDNSPAMQSRLVCNDPKTQKKFKIHKTIITLFFQRYTLWPEVSSPLGSGFLWGDRRISQLIYWQKKLYPSPIHHPTILNGQELNISQYVVVLLLIENNNHFFRQCTSPPPAECSVKFFKTVG